MKYGLIAGNGQFPFLVVEGARRMGTSLAVVAIREETDKRIDEVSDDVNKMLREPGELPRLANKRITVKSCGRS